MSSTPVMSRRRLLFGAEGSAPAVREAEATPMLAVITAARCLNAAGVVCASCADSCAQRAIIIPLRQRAAIHVLPALCNGCSDCIAVCPTQAIALHPARQECA